MEEDMMEFLLDHYKNPRNYGTLESPTVTHEEGNSTCGDVVKIDLLIEDDVVRDVKFTGEGCAISQASASILTDLVMGKGVIELRAMDMDHFLRELGIKLTPVRLKCALLPLKVFKTALYGITEWPDERKTG